jgi:hypothetical protein
MGKLSYVRKKKKRITIAAQYQLCGDATINFAAQPEVRGDAYSDMLPLVPRPKTKSYPIIEKEWRIMIAGYFRKTLKCPPKEDWGGPGGTIANILDTFHLPEGAQPRIERVLEYVVMYKKRVQVYTGERKMGQNQ